MSVPVHPEPVAGSDRELRWVMPAGALDFVGAVRGMPAPLCDLVADGTVESVLAEPGALRVRLGSGRTWRAEGARVRTALQHGLARSSDWSPAVEGSPDDVLAMAVTQVVEGPVGDYIRSHGGALGVLGVADGFVEVELSGSCSHCPAAELTLAGRFETAVRELYPGLRGVRARENAPAGPRTSGLLTLRRFRPGRAQEQAPLRG